MKQGIIKRVVKTFLLVTLIIIGLIIFHYKFGFWWDRPSVDAHNITEIVIYENQFILPGQSPVITLDGLSDEAEAITGAINCGWYYPDLIKFGADYSIFISYADSNKVTVVVGGQCMSVHAADKTRRYHDYKNINKLIENIREKPQPMK